MCAQLAPKECSTDTTDTLVSMPANELDDLIYLISHDVRNSVRALIEVPQWIEEDLREAGHSISGSLAENIDLMTTHTRRLDRMLFDLLVHSRIGRMQNISIVELADAFRSIEMEVAIPPEFQITTDFSCSNLKVGETDILTLFSSLISNAVKHSDVGSGNIQISSSKEGDFCKISVLDDGPGIPPKYHKKVLSTMSTLKPRDEVEGSGMGLAHVQKIADYYGGRVAIQSSEDRRGTCVSVWLPIDPEIVHSP